MTPSVRPGVRYTYLALDLILIAGIPAGVLTAVAGFHAHDRAELLAGAVTAMIGVVGMWLGEQPHLARLAGPTGTPLSVVAWMVHDVLARFGSTDSTDTMSAADRAVWAEARSLRDIGDRTAMWFAGELKSQPGYGGPVDVDESRAPGLTETLILLSLAGFVTSSSQAGADGLGADGAHWQQYAAVSGFAAAETEAWLRDALHGVDGIVINECVEQGRFDWNEVDPVTYRDGHAHTDFGRAFPEDDMRDDWTGYGMCHADAVEEMAAAGQFVIRDTEFGRNDRLWPALHAAALQHQPRR